MRLKDRLKLYETALKDYTNAIGQSRQYKINNNIDCGLCWYFDENHFNGEASISELINKLPELFTQRPCGSFWFPIGEVEPRIECIKKAIKATKRKMK